MAQEFRLVKYFFIYPDHGIIFCTWESIWMLFWLWPPTSDIHIWMMLISSGNQGTIPTWRQVSAIFSLVNGFISVRFNEWNVWDMDGMLTGCYQVFVPPKKLVFLGTIMILYDGLLLGIWWDILIYQGEVIQTDCESLECWLVGGNYPKMAEVWRFVQRNGVHITHTIHHNPPNSKFVW